jgi:L-alanine-DL-glutamate epimerase-like enolase superfamily enzyme
VPKLLILQMKIKRLFINQITAPLKTSLVTAQLHRTTSCNIILQIEFDNGLWGYGESTPREYVTGESPSTVFEMISRHFWPILKVANFEQLADVKELVLKLNKYLEDSDGLFHGSALCAVELALLDGLGKLLEKPLHYILGEPLREQIEYSIGLPCVSALDLPKYFQAINDYQPRYLKVKVGQTAQDDLLRVAKIRAYFGNQVELRVDANCQWDISTAMMMAGKLEKLGVVAIEQPLAKDDIEGFKQLKKITPLKIIADESACSFNDVSRLIEEEACDLVSVKISKCGGLINSLKIAEYIYETNKLCVLGAHVAETGILEAAGRIFGALAQNVRYFEGSMSLFVFDEQVVEEFTGFDKHCLASLSAKSGLGIAIKREGVKKYTVRERSLINKS